RFVVRAAVLVPPALARPGRLSRCTLPKRNTSAPRAPNYASRVTNRTVTRQQGATMLKEEIEIEKIEEMEYVPRGNVVVPISRRLGLT
ncbi:hypothetical protein ACC687_39615, partial [Rhizobium ruizarguesonis]